MEQDYEREGLKHLAKIEEELEQIKERTQTARHPFFNGVLQGGGAIIGGIVTVILLGWILSLFGIIPGLGEISAYLQNIVSQFHSKY